MPNSPASASKGFSSTPVKAGQKQDFFTDDGVLSDDEGTFSLLSPIYHESFDSDDDDDDDDPELSFTHRTSQSQNKSSRASVSPIR